MPPCIARLLRALRRARPAQRRADLQTVRSALLAAVDDCQGPDAEQLKRQLGTARQHRDLWMLRSGTYRLIALQHCQAIADGRMHGLLHLFEGWVDPKELRRMV
ncbi:hypothetical protein [Hydrogenophaga sp.]|uniref:hypothetical protein n=1 Tax=Hydrogenophaga sp. TaxID=1904254 RepID=UPI00286D6BB7|nr:hypothetical protein [Hydrogenophaga sp.]